MSNTPPSTIGQNFTQQQEDMLKMIQYINDQLLLQRQQTEEINTQLELTQQDINKKTQQIEIDEQAAELKREMRDVDWQRLGFVKGITETVSRQLSLAEKISNFSKEQLKHDAKIEAITSAIEKNQGNAGLKNKLEALKISAQIEKDLQTKMHTAQLGMMSRLIPPNVAARIGQTLSSASFSIALLVGQGFFALAGGLWKLIKGVLGFLWERLKEVLAVFLDIQKEIGNLSADLGLSVYQTDLLYNNIREIGVSALKFGVTFKEALGFMRSFSEITGLNRVFLADEVKQLSAVAKSTGLGVEQAGKMYANMELVGMSTEAFHTYVENTRKSAVGLNLNITKVLNTVNTLLPAFRGLNFKDGMTGLTRLVEKAQGLRFELTNMRSLANKIFNPEGAIELAAKLRVLGGGFAEMGDAFSLMLKGQTDPEGLMDDITRAVSGLAIKGQDGLFTIPPVQQALLREFAEATGENVDNLINASTQMAKQADVISKIKGGSMLPEKDKALIANLAEMGDNGKYMIRIDAKGTKIALDTLNEGQVNNIKTMLRGEEEASRGRLNIVEQFKNIYQMLLVSLAPLFQKVSNALQNSGFLSILMTKVQNFAEYLGNKLSAAITDGSLQKTFDGLILILQKVSDILTGKENFTTKIVDAITLIIKTVFNEITPAIAAMLNNLGIGGVVRGTAAAMGGLAGAGAGVIGGAGIGFMAGGPVGSLVGGIIGGIVGALSGGGAGYGVANKILPSTAKDFLMTSDGTIQRYSAGDAILGFDEDAVQRKMSVSNSVLPKTPSEQVRGINQERLSVGGLSPRQIVSDQIVKVVFPKTLMEEFNNNRLAVGGGVPPMKQTSIEQINNLTLPNRLTDEIRELNTSGLMVNTSKLTQKPLEPTSNMPSHQSLAEQMYRLNKNDVVAGNQQIIQKSDDRVADMVSSKSLLDQTKIYNKNQFSNIHLTTASQKNTPETINLNLTGNGTLRVESKDNSVYLTSADLKNIGIQQLAYAIRNENDRWINHGSGKRLQSEIISPIGNTA